MTTETDLIVEQGKASIARSRARRTDAPKLSRSIGTRSRRYKMRHLGQKGLRIILWWVALLIGAIAFSLVVSPLGVTGVIVLAMMALMGSLVFAIFPQMPAMTEDRLLSSDMASLPAKTEIWLEAQRPALPAPAQQVVDGIGVQLDTLGLQLETLDPREPAADEVRRLVGEHLPGLVNGYKRVPPAMRARPNAGGRSADQELVDGLKVIEREIQTMSENIASGDLNALATRGRYLEIKYQEQDNG